MLSLKWVAGVCEHVKSAYLLAGLSPRAHDGRVWVGRIFPGIKTVRGT